MINGNDSNRKSKSLCIIIPTYQEAVSIGALIEELEDRLYPYILKIIIVDDNSPDGTVEIAETLNEKYANISVNCRLDETGVGSAIKEGLDMALALSECEFMVIMDADLSHRVDDIPHLMNGLEGADIVQGSRYVKGGKTIGWSLSRRMTSWTANTICRVLLRTGIGDHTGFFCLSTRDTARILADNLTSNGFEWAIERILIAKNNGLKIKEVPITFINRRSGQSKLKLATIFNWAVSIARIFLSRVKSKSINQE